VSWSINPNSSNRAIGGTPRTGEASTSGSMKVHICSLGPGPSYSGVPAAARTSTAAAAFQPHMPWTPPPGGVEDEQR
jgi:hypothetical protein